MKEYFPLNHILAECNYFCKYCINWLYINTLRSVGVYRMFYCKSDIYDPWIINKVKETNIEGFERCLYVFCVIPESVFDYKLQIMKNYLEHFTGSGNAKYLRTKCIFLSVSMIRNRSDVNVFFCLTQLHSSVYLYIWFAQYFHFGRDIWCKSCMVSNIWDRQTRVK